MALHRGIQSAIFYYVSCAPCADARYRKKRKQEAKRDRAEREILHDEMPNLYRHPSPSSTNPHWHAEIALGPARPPRGKRKTNNTAEAKRGRTAGIVSGDTSAAPSLVNLPPGNGDGSDARWNHVLYQREDDELWGSSTTLPGDSIQRPPQARVRDPASSSFKTYRNPPINDGHPAIATLVNSREEIAWMMQPPPMPDVMSGKERPTRSVSGGGSVGSRLSPGSIPMSRQGSSNLSERRMRTPDMPTSNLSREHSVRGSIGPIGQRHDRDTTIDARDFALRLRDEPELDVPPPASRKAGSGASTRTVLHHPSLASEPIRPASTRNGASRPQLSTIMSMSEASVPRFRSHGSTDTPPTTASDASSSSKAAFTRRSAVLIDGDHKTSYRVVQDLAPGVLGPRKQLPRPRSEVESAHTGHAREDSSDDALSAVKPELFDSWYTPDFELPKWVAEHTKREVRERWSMDL